MDDKIAITNIDLEIPEENILENDISRELTNQDDIIDTNKINLNWTKDIVDETISGVHITAYIGYPDDKSFTIIKFVMLRDGTTTDICSKRAHLLAAFQTYTDLYLDNLLDTLGYDISEVYQVDKISDNQIELSFVINPYDYVTGIRIDFMGSYNVFMEDIVNIMKKGEVVNVPKDMVDFIGNAIVIAGEHGINLFMYREALIKKAFNMIDDIWDDDKNEK